MYILKNCIKNIAKCICICMYICMSCTYMVFIHFCIKQAVLFDYIILTLEPDKVYILYFTYIQTVKHNCFYFLYKMRAFLKSQVSKRIYIIRSYLQLNLYMCKSICKQCLFIYLHVLLHSHTYIHTYNKAKILSALHLIQFCN